MVQKITEFFSLREEHVDTLSELLPSFGYNGYGEIVYYRTYSRKKPYNSVEANLPLDKWTGQESWKDTVLRVTNGTFSIRKDWYLRNSINWDEDKWQDYAIDFATAMFNLEWCPPGRGLWAMGTQFIYERGSMALYNCAFTYLTSNNLSDDVEWLMDSLMLGVGVGWDATHDEMQCQQPRDTFVFIIQDTRESWCRATALLIDAYTKPGARLPVFDYRDIRKKGLLIRGFGGLSSGPEPLMKLHKQIQSCFNRYLNTNDYDVVQLKADIANMVGCCVVAGNVRRSAEIGMGWITDEVFLNLKNYDLYPERQEYGWMSNNTVKCLRDEHFELLGRVAQSVVVRGEPGIANLRNFPKGRLNGKNETREDKALGLNPCGEITLEHRETCNVVETVPTNCSSIDKWYAACEFASFYASTVSLYPTHQSSTNAVVTRNRRIGVGIIDYTGWVKNQGQHNVIRYLRRGYDIVSSTNRTVNAEAGIPSAIKVTTIKPGGTVPKLPGKTAGAGYPTFKYCLRRTRIANNHPMLPLLQNANIPIEPLIGDEWHTSVFSYPIYQEGSKEAKDVTIWEQALNIVTIQREWADNCVSNTIYFKPKWVLSVHLWNPDEVHGFLVSGDLLDKGTDFVYNGDRYIVGHVDGRPTELKMYEYDPNHEEDDIEAVMSMIVPSIKSISFLPHSAKGVYKQMPEEGMTEEEYMELKAKITQIDWSEFRGSDGVDEKYCSGSFCEIPV